jgi:hypothetical protein
MIILVATIIFTLLLTFTNYKIAYFPARKILEVAESPILIMILFPIFILNEKLKNTSYEK